MSTLNTTYVVPEPVAGMHEIELFEPAMCCQTGVCGPSVDQQLIEVREDLRWAKGRGATVSRHNLTSDPDAFVANSKVTGLMAAFGEHALPVLLIDGEIKIHGRYATREELASLLDPRSDPVELPVRSGGCGCRAGRLLMMSLPDGQRSCPRWTGRAGARAICSSPARAASARRP